LRRKNKSEKNSCKEKAHMKEKTRTREDFFEEESTCERAKKGRAEM